MGIGYGLDEVALAATNTITLGANVYGTSTMSALASHPSEFLHGAVDGIQEQGHEVALAANGISNQIVPGTNASAALLASHTTWVPASSTADLIGFHQGMVVAQDAEKFVATQVGSEIFWKITESISGLCKVSQRVSCRRQLTVGGIACNNCKEDIEGGIYYRKILLFA